MQKSTTADLLFDAAAIISYVSQIITLLPGDVIATGTPGGVGAGRDPKVFLRADQVLTTRIDGVGELVNACVDEQTA
jgi:acylpyruvate hydrolase